MKQKLFWPLIYVLSVLAINVAFAWRPDLNWLWSIAVGSIFVTRDFCQRAIGHWVVVPMAVGLALSYLLASPFVALASAAAFAVSESVDWLVFTVTKRPLADRVLLSCGLSAPADSVVFLSIIGALSPLALGAQIASKLVAALVVWGGLSARRVTA
jgi:uncharacterized PurR-regulated membrane protein YhhQ (DUF165 family)